MERDLSPMEKEVNEHLVDILKDSLEDSKKVVKRLQATIVLLIVLLVGSFVFYVYSFYSYLAMYDIESTVTQEFQTSGETKGSVNISDINKNNSVKLRDK